MNLVRKVIAGVLFLAAFPADLPAQTPRSPYLIDPDLAIGYVDSCARFWFNAYDSLRGGFYMNIDRSGGLISSWGTGKNTLNQSRNAYGFLRAYMLTGNAQYLTFARRALDFLYRSGWDSTNGGWYNEVNRDGVPSNPTANKTAYYQHYALLGITASVEVTDDSLDRVMLERSLMHNETRFWDARPHALGYYDRTLANGTQPSGKSFNATVDAITTHMLSLYLMTGDSTYGRRLRQLGDNMVDRLAASSASQAIGFVEGFDTEWNPDPANTMTIMGHVLKTAWCLGRLYVLFQDTSYLGAANRLVESVIQKGYDRPNGGPYKDYNRVTGDMLMWGQKDTAKAWWQMEQAVTAGLLLDYCGHYSFASLPALQMADQTLDFFMQHFVDHVYGEVYENRTKYGGQIWDTNKGSSGKAAYHSIELGYYVYLYGKLLLRKEPATLHYAFSPRPYERTIRLQPIVGNVSYTLAGVWRNGERHDTYDAWPPAVRIPAYVGGEFEVTFAPVITGAGDEPIAAVPREAQLWQNFPNPFNPSTTIQFALPEPGRTVVTVHDILGREVARLMDGHAEAGTHRLTFSGDGLSSGVYFYRLQAPGVQVTMRMLLTK